MAFMGPDVLQVPCTQGVLAGPEQPSVLFTEGPVFAFDCIALLHRYLLGVRKRANNGVDRDDCGAIHVARLPHRRTNSDVAMARRNKRRAFSSTGATEIPPAITIPFSAV